MNLFRTRRHSDSNQNEGLTRQMRRKLERRLRSQRSSARSERSLLDGFETLEDRVLLSANPVGDSADDVHGPAGVDVPFGVFTAAEIAELEAVPFDSALSTKTPPSGIADGGHVADVLTFVLDFKEAAQGDTTDGFGNVISEFDVTDFGFAAEDFDTVADAVLAEVDEDYFTELVGTVAGPVGEDLAVDFIIGDIGTAPVGVTEYYYVQIGTGESGPHSGGTLGVAAGSAVRNEFGGGPSASVGDVVASVFTDAIVGLGGLTPSDALTTANLPFTTFAISGTLSHEIGHNVSLSHINKAGSTQPTPGASPIMGTGAIDLPNQDRITDREFSLSGVDGQNLNAPRQHIQQLVDAIDLHAYGPIANTLSPADDSTGVALNTDLTITFDRDVLKGSGDIRVMRVSDDVTVQTIDVTDSAVSIVDDEATIDLADLDESTEYYIQVDAGAFTDFADFDFAGILDTTTWSFTTLGIPPTVTALSPADDTTFVPLDTNLVITFDEAIAKGSGDIFIKRVSDDVAEQTIDVTTAAVGISGAVATINPTDLSQDTAYYIQVDPGAFEDLKGNAYAGITDMTTWNIDTTSCTAVDDWGYQACAVSPAFNDISTTGTAITFDDPDEATAELTDAMLADFQFKFYGTTYDNLFVSTNGTLSFGTAFGGVPFEYENTDLTAEAQAIIAPLWDDLVDSGAGEAYWEVKGTGKREILIVQWEQWDYFDGSASGDITFQAILNEYDNSIQFNYDDLLDAGDSQSEGAEATVGIKDAGLQGGNRLLISQDSGPNSFVGSDVSVLIKDTSVAVFDGTPGDDVFVFDASGADYVVRVNGVETILDATLIREIKFDGLGGDDAIQVTGNSLNDTATLNPGSLVVENSAYILTACTIETIRMSGGEGFDQAYLNDSAGNDRFFGRPAYSYMTGTDFYNRVEDFDKVFANALAGDEGGSGDRAFFYDSTGNDMFSGQPTVSYMNGSGYYNEAENFDQVYAYALEGNAGGPGDRAFMQDSAGNETFVGRPTHSTMTGADFFYRAEGFGKVYAYATAGDAGGAGDRATLHDSAGNDKFLSYPAMSRLSGVNFFNWVEGFDKVTANASGDAGGPRDRAYLHGSAGNDIFRGRPTTSFITGSDFFNQANGFDKVLSYAGDDAGGVGDRAYLYDSSGNDKFFGRPTYSYITGTGFLNRAEGFDGVYSYASTDLGGVGDRAYLFDSAGNDEFYGRPTYSYITGSGFFNRAADFDNVFAYAEEGDDGGVGDRAYVYDSIRNDTFFGRSTFGRLTGNGFLIFAKGFDRIDAFAYMGGFDTIDNRALAYDFFSYGDWEKIL